MFAAFVVAAALQGTPTVAATVLARALQAQGGPALERIVALHYQERVTALGLNGPGEEWDDCLTGRYVQSESIGPIAGSQGYDLKHPWAQDATGLAHLQDSRDDVSTAITQAYVTSFSYFFLDRRPATITAQGRKTLDNKTYDVLRAQPRGGYPVDLWFDEDTHLLARGIITFSPTRQTITEFSDYRTVDGAVLPYHVHTMDSHGNEFETSVTRIDTNQTAAKSYSMPAFAPHDFAMAQGATSTTFPIEVINNHIYLDAKIDGKGPYHFIFDTGGQGVLNPDVAASLGIHPAGAMQAGGAGAGTVQTGFAWVPKTQLGLATLSHQSFAILPLGPVMQAIEGVHIDGMVGYETVARYLTTIDYSHHTMTLSLPKPGVRPPGVAVPFVFYETIPQFKGGVDGLPATIEVDTGSRASLTLMSPFVAAHGLTKKYPSSVGGITGYGIGGPSTANVARVKSLSIGSVAVPNVIVDLSTDTKGAMADPSLSGNLGGGVLKRFVVTFDYRNQVMYLQKNVNFDTTDVADRSGLVLVAVPMGIRVVGVLTATPAAIAGIKPRDIIQSVNGTPADKLGLIRIRQILSGKPGSIVTLTVSSGDATRSVSLTLKDYV